MTLEQQVHDLEVRVRKLERLEKEKQINVEIEKRNLKERQEFERKNQSQYTKEELTPFKKKL